MGADAVEEAVLELAGACALAWDDASGLWPLIELGSAFVERVYGDRAENLDQSAEALARGLAMAESGASADELATCRTRLAYTLLVRENGSTRSPTVSVQLRSQTSLADMRWTPEI